MVEFPQWGILWYLPNYPFSCLLTQQFYFWKFTLCNGTEGATVYNGRLETPDVHPWECE